MSLVVQAFRCGPLDNGVYVLYHTIQKNAVVIDPSFGPEPIIEFLQTQKLHVEKILLTHGHFDHLSGLAALHAYAPDAPIYLHEADRELVANAEEQARLFGLQIGRVPQPTEYLTNETEISLLGISWQILHVPGHSPGSVCFYHDTVLISGDVLFRGSVGRTDLPGGSSNLLLSGIKRSILPLPDETHIYPGHGPSTTLSWERQHNPFL